MVIRAFAAHPQYRKSPEALQAAQLLKSHFLKSDNYNSYKHPDNWIRFEYPFWWNNLTAALDSVSLIGIRPPTRMSGGRWTGSPPTRRRPACGGFPILKSINRRRTIKPTKKGSGFRWPSAGFSKDISASYRK